MHDGSDAGSVPDIVMLACAEMVEGPRFVIAHIRNVVGSNPTASLMPSRSMAGLRSLEAAIVVQIHWGQY